MTPLPLTTEFLFRMVLQAGAPQMETGAEARGGMLRVVPVTGGTFEGPGLKGTLVPAPPRTGCAWSPTAPPTWTSGW